jgi:hypothetical protein
MTIEEAQKTVDEWIGKSFGKLLMSGLTLWLPDKPRHELRNRNK